MYPSGRLRAGCFALNRQAAALEDVPFDCAQGRPFDCAQGRPFDCAQGRPFDYVQGRGVDWRVQPSRGERTARPPRWRTWV